MYCDMYYVTAREHRGQFTQAHDFHFLADGIALFSGIDHE